MKKLSIFLAIILIFIFPLSSFAESNIQSVHNSDLINKYEGYNLSNPEVVSEIYVNDVDFRNFTKSFTKEKINTALQQAVKIKNDKNNKDNEKVKGYLKKLQELGAIDSNYKIITEAKAKKLTSVNSISPAFTPPPSFDLRGNCIANANTMNATYTTYYYLGIVLYGNPVSAVAYAYGAIGIFFTSKVQTGGEWDYKATLGTYNVYTVNICSRTYYWSGEVIGNFHYGYVGSTKFAPIILLSAAGLVQIISGTSNISYWSSYFDDPVDQTYIQSGIDVYNAGNI
jgi:hypothetical protein